MALAALLALTVLASGPESALPPTTTTVAVANSSNDDVPPGAPKDDYLFVSWCYGAMDESISVYQSIIPELKAIDKRIGSPFKEAVPYAQDVAEERTALKRFGAAMEAAERANPRPIAPMGARAMQQGRAMWSQAKLQSPRQLAHAWLMWGSPDRCETTAKTLKERATLFGQAMAIGAPRVLLTRAAKIAPGTGIVVKFELALGGVEYLLELTGVVRAAVANTDEPELGAGYGLQFAEVSPEDSLIISAFVFQQLVENKAT